MMLDILGVMFVMWTGAFLLCGKFTLPSGRAIYRGPFYREGKPTEPDVAATAAASFFCNWWDDNRHNWFDAGLTPDEMAAAADDYQVYAEKAGLVAIVTYDPSKHDHDFKTLYYPGRMIMVLDLTDRGRAVVKLGRESQ